MTSENEDRANVQGQMLPGIAGVCLFLIFMTMVNVYAAVQGAYGYGAGRYAILAMSTLMAAGIFGLLRLRRWGWSVVTAGCLLLAAGDGYIFARFHQAFFMVRGLFVLLFFLYLSRQETRERLR